MKRLILLFVAVIYTCVAYSQNTLKVIIKDSQSKEPLTGASILLNGTTNSAISDVEGLGQLQNIPNGRQVIQFSFVGYEVRIDTLVFPLSTLLPIEIFLAINKNELGEVVVSAARSSRTIDNVPIRVEVISHEELDEKGNMKPGDIRMLLAESTGIQTQQTSATSSNSSIRIQGLDGKYTQTIRDGFPLYSGFSGGLGLLQIAPLDLKQVEVIKGSSSTLYGGGAIAGLVNLVSKTPTEKRELNFLLNGTSALGFDASSFYSQRFSKTGITIYTAYNHGTPYDPAGIGLTAIPEFNRFTLNPKLFLYFNDRTSLNIGINSTIERRTGGDTEYIKGNGSQTHSYFERNKTNRSSTQFEFVHRLNTTDKLLFKNSISYYNRTITLPGYNFSGIQASTYSEANYSHVGKQSEWVTGINLVTDKFTEKKVSSFPLRSYNQNTIGGFLQNTENISNKFTLETGIRGDYHNTYGFFFLPRVSALWKINPHLSTRLGGGLGYKAPNVFTEDAERIQFKNVLPIDPAKTRAERSYGANYDVNYRTNIFNNHGSFSINQLLFYTRINKPIQLTALTNGNFQYLQPDGNIITKGIETNVKVTYKDLKLFIGYTLADVQQNTGVQKITYSLVSRHRLNNVLMYEIEDKLKLGLEAYYYSPQKLNDGTTGKAYWTAGFMGEKIWEQFSLFINFENLTDTRQTKFDTIYSGSIIKPVFRDIYAPLDGFVINGGIKFKL